MKRKLFTLLAISLMAMFAVSLTSCDEQKPDGPNTEEPGNTDEPNTDDPNNGDDPNQGGNSGGSTDHGAGVPDKIPTPIDWSVEKVEATDDGVSIEITEVVNKNFKFVVRPGANVASYRLDVFPLCRLYNSLFEQMRAEGMDPATEVASADQIEDWILSYVFNSQGAGAYTFSSDALGEEFFNKEFDWANSQYDQAKIVPGCEYVIVAVGCFDKDGSENQAGDLSICYVETPSEELVGEPAIDIQVQTNYTAMQVTQVPNKDTHYLYYWCSNEDDLTPYIETYGAKQYIDFMRNTVYDAPSVDVPENLSYYVNFGAATDVKFMATAVGCDVNETPSKEFQSKVFTLKQRPEDRLPARATVSVDESHLGASMFRINYTIERNSWALFFRVMTKDIADGYADASEAELVSLGYDLRTTGWGVNNHKYKYDIDEDELWGDADSGSEVWTAEVKPETEYVIAYTAVNQYSDIAPVQFTEPFKTKALVTDAPEQCTGDINLEMTTLGVDGIKTEFSFDPENVAQFHFAFIQGDVAFPVAEDASREVLIRATYDGVTTAKVYNDNGQLVTSEVGTNANHWPATYDGKDAYSWFALTPNTRYVVAYVAEDWNGVLGEVKMAEATTDALVGGPNPEVKLSVVEDEEGNSYFQFETVKDCYMMYYAVVSQELYPDMTLIGSDGSYSYWYKAVYDFFVNQGAYMATYRQNFVQPLNFDGGYCLAIAMGWGKDADGNDVASKMHTLFYNKRKGTVLSLEETYPNATHYVAPLVESQQSNFVAPVSVSKNYGGRVVPASDVVVPELAPVKVDLNEWLDDEAAKGVKIVPINLQKLGAHPHAKM